MLKDYQEKGLQLKARQTAFSTILITHRLSQAALVSDGLVTKEEFLKLAGEAFDSISKLMDDTTELYVQKWTNKQLELPHVGQCMTNDYFLDELLRILGVDPSKVTDLHWVDYPYAIGYSIQLEHPVKFFKISFDVG